MIRASMINGFSAYQKANVKLKGNPVSPKLFPLSFNDTIKKTVSVFVKRSCPYPAWRAFPQRPMLIDFGLKSSLFILWPWSCFHKPIIPHSTRK